MTKTCRNIEKKLEDLKHRRHQARIDDNYHIEVDCESQIHILEWVLDLEEGEASHFPWAEEWEDKNAPKEEIRNPPV